ncbi:transketolase [bacterium]|nr:transketolase [bacterium]
MTTKDKDNQLESSSMRDVFGETLLSLAKTNKKIYVVNADLKSSVRLGKFASWYRHRFIECGVAEANAAAVAAGLAKTGKVVFLTSFSCFSPAINWAVIKQSICYNQANVKIIGSHSGLMSANLGATHQMLEDIALTRALPHMGVFAPIDALETKKMITTLVRSPQPAYIRLVRPTTHQIFPQKFDFTIGKSHLLQTGKHITVAGYGPILIQAIQAQQRLNQKHGTTAPQLEIINCSSIKPLDTATIKRSVKKTGKLVVIEDHQKNGGLGEAIATFLLASNLSPQFIHLAVNDQFGQSAKNYQKLYTYYGISLNHLLRAVQKLLKN